MVLGRDVPEDLVTNGYATAAVGVVCLVGAAVYMTWTARFLMVVRG
jgi:hypothetical protein